MNTPVTSYVKEENGKWKWECCYVYSDCTYDLLASGNEDSQLKAEEKAHKNYIKFKRKYERDWAKKQKEFQKLCKKVNK